MRALQLSNVNDRLRERSYADEQQSFGRFDEVNKPGFDQAMNLTRAHSGQHHRLFRAEHLRSAKVADERASPGVNYQDLIGLNRHFCSTPSHRPALCENPGKLKRRCQVILLFNCFPSDTSRQTTSSHQS